MNFGGDINSLLSNIINNQGFPQQNPNANNAYFEDTNNSEDSNNYAENNEEEAEEQLNEEDLIKMKEEIINNFNKYKFKNVLKLKKKRIQE